MPATGEVIHGWKVYNQSVRRKVWWRTMLHGWIEEPRFELAKGQRHIDARGEDGIDPAIVLARAVTAALEDDIRQAHDANNLDEVARLQVVLAHHNHCRALLETSWAVRRVLTRHGNSARFGAPTATATVKAEATHGEAERVDPETRHASRR